ncbi:MAG: dTMP kinase [Legionellales bacterium]
MQTVTGKLVVLEGLEGAGKSTAINTLTDLLSTYNISYITTREPGGTSIGELLRAIIKNPEYQDVLEDRSELLLLYAARVQLIEQVIKPALARGSWVVADRFELSTFAYQGGGRGVDPVFLNQLSAFSLEGFKPDLTLFLDIDPEIGMQRARLRSQFDRIEQQSMAFFDRVHAAYKHHIQSDSSVLVIKASASVEEVQSTIQKLFQTYIEQQGL